MCELREMRLCPAIHCACLGLGILRGCLGTSTQMAVSPDELAELESAEEWVKMMAQCEEQVGSGTLGLVTPVVNRKVTARSILNLSA